MSKIVVVGLTALLVSAASQVQAQPAPANPAAQPGTTMQLPSAAEWKQFTDARIDLLKNALQLTPAQQKFWPPLEEAIRARAEARQARVTSLVSRLEGGRRDTNVIELLRARADNLEQRSESLKKFVNAWQPMYESLDNAQKTRLRILTAYVLHEMRDAAYDRMARAEEEFED
jgi:hypothetical protein